MSEAGGTVSACRSGVCLEGTETALSAEVGRPSLASEVGVPRGNGIQREVAMRFRCRPRKSEWAILSGVRMPVPRLCLERTIWMFAGRVLRGAPAAPRVFGVAYVAGLEEWTLRILHGGDLGLAGTLPISESSCSRMDLRHHAHAGDCGHAPERFRGVRHGLAVLRHEARRRWPRRRPSDRDRMISVYCSFWKMALVHDPRGGQVRPMCLWPGGIRVRGIRRGTCQAAPVMATELNGFGLDTPNPLMGPRQPTVPASP